MTRKIKRIVIPLILIALLATAYAYYLYNKGPLDVVSSTAIKMSSDDLYQQFSTDSATAIKKYAGKVIAVSGTVDGLSTNQQKQMIVLIKTNTDGGYINCTMEESDEQIKTDRQVTLKGICSGIGQGDEDLGIKGDVYLARCYLIN